MRAAPALLSPPLTSLLADGAFRAALHKERAGGGDAGAAAREESLTFDGFLYALRRLAHIKSGATQRQPCWATPPPPQPPPSTAAAAADAPATPDAPSATRAERLAEQEGEPAEEEAAAAPATPVEAPKPVEAVPVPVPAAAPIVVVGREELRGWERRVAEMLAAAKSPEMVSEASPLVTPQTLFVRKG